MFEKMNNCVKFYETYKEIIEINYEHHKKMYNNIFENMNNEKLNDFYKCYFLATNQKTSFVYFIYNQYTKLIKIGHSNNPVKRKNQLNTMFKTNFGIDKGLEIIGLKYVPSLKGKELEKYFHEKYKDFKTYGEWFSISKNEVINECIIGDMLVDGILVDIDTDRVLYNEGFDKIEYKHIDDEYIYQYAIRDLTNIIQKHSKDIKVTEMIINHLLSYNTTRFNNDIPKENDVLIVSLGNSDVSLNNVTWNMYKWLNENNNKYALSTGYKIINNKTTSYILSIGKPTIIFKSTELIIDKIQKCLTEGYVDSLLEVKANA